MGVKNTRKTSVNEFQSPLLGSKSLHLLEKTQSKMSNHFKNHQIFSTKNGLLDTLCLIFKSDMKKVFSIMPLSFKIEKQPSKGIKGLKVFS